MKTTLLLIILSILFIIVISLLGISIWKVKNKQKQTEEKLRKSEQANKELNVIKTTIQEEKIKTDEQLNEARHQAAQLSTKVIQFETELKNQEEQKAQFKKECEEQKQNLKEFEEKFNAAKIAGVKLENIQSSLNQLAPQYEKRRLEEESRFRQQQENYDNTLKQSAASVQESLKTKTQLEAANKSLQKEEDEWRRKIDESKQFSAELKAQIEQCQNELASLQETHRLAVIHSAAESVEEIPTIEFTLNNDERCLLQDLQKIKQDFPSLTSDFAAIEWKRIWMPKFQQQLKKNGWYNGTRGIYKLTSIKDPTRCYVGQAQDIKERWYQHAKKMIGADAAGNEELYKQGNPSDFTWTLLEQVDNPQESLDEKEHYWISFFGCQEIGFNKRK